MTTLRTMIERAVRAKGSQARLAEAMGCSQQQISYLLNEAKSVTGDMAVSIDRATAGAVSKHELRPDLFGPAPTKAVAS